jgi:NAD(P)-dependent dehydrogenase (short-subunit alcohol dehydrogenase family)
MSQGSIKQEVRIALVTGAVGGIGQSLVRSFAQHGYDVIGMDRIPRPIGFLGSHYLEADLDRLVRDETYKAEKTEYIREILKHAGLCVLVNNAAVQVLGGVDSLTMRDWQHTLNVNVLAPFALTQALLPHLEAARGCVIHISSIHARLTKAGFVAYATSKAALSGMTRAMAVDLGGRVRVNAIEPAAIGTSMLMAGFAGKPDLLTQLEGCHPQGRIGSPEEVAALAVSMASGELRFLHGACVGMDGGISGRLFDPL